MLVANNLLRQWMPYKTYALAIHLNQRLDDRVICPCNHSITDLSITYVIPARRLLLQIFCSITEQKFCQRLALWTRDSSYVSLCILVGTGSRYKDIINIKLTIFNLHTRYRYRYLSSRYLFCQELISMLTQTYWTYFLRMTYISTVYSLL